MNPTNPNYPLPSTIITSCIAQNINLKFLTHFSFLSSSFSSYFWQHVQKKNWFFFWYSFDLRVGSRRVLSIRPTSNCNQTVAFEPSRRAQDTDPRHDNPRGHLDGQNREKTCKHGTMRCRFPLLEDRMAQRDPCPSQIDGYVQSQERT